MSANGHHVIALHVLPIEPTTDPVPPIPGECRAMRRMREAAALDERLRDERAAAKAGGPEPRKW